eukprot:3567203-Amphidinium_carterae.1
MARAPVLEITLKELDVVERPPKIRAKHVQYTQHGHACIQVPEALIPVLPFTENDCMLLAASCGDGRLKSLN